jgi:hypothetical protein
VNGRADHSEAQQEREDADKCAAHDEPFARRLQGASARSLHAAHAIRTQFTVQPVLYVFAAITPYGGQRRATQLPS